MVAFAGIDQAIWLMKAAADDLLVKPIEIQDLRGRIAALMGRRMVTSGDATLGISGAIRHGELRGYSG